MPPRKSAPKRKASPVSEAGPSNSHSGSTETPGRSSRPPPASVQTGNSHGIILRQYYPAEMSIVRARAYAEGAIVRPIEELRSALAETTHQRQAVEVKDAVVHWFKMDLRHTDNTALRLASDKATEAGVPLICMYIMSPQDFEAHLLSPARVDFMLRSLEVLKHDLGQLDIPLYVETVERRHQVPDRIRELMDEWGANHLFANMEYEVDELRRETRIVSSLAANGKSFEVVHDTCVVPPGELQSGAGKQYSVYTPWYRSWVSHIHNNPDLLTLHGAPRKNPGAVRQQFRGLFESSIPEAPESKLLDQADRARFITLWPSGEHEALNRLEEFCQEKIGAYAEDRSTPSTNCNSCLSVHLASGTISSRTCVSTARRRNTSRRLNAGREGIVMWISEVAWRDFYRHVLVHWPHVCMNKPYKPEFSNIAWSYNGEHLMAWRDGRTGFPIVDAAMRQLNHSGYMHNRCRMIVASFLAKDLLIDWRHGEQYFMEHLVDGDFASNNGGWGFSASVGIDPQPYFRIFNPLLQSERYDPDGEYIRHWVPELLNVQGKAIHDPYNRGAGDQARSAGYPEPIVDHKRSRERALRAYKEAIGTSR